LSGVDRQRYKKEKKARDRRDLSFEDNISALQNLTDISKCQGIQDQLLCQ
jgi:hypothetical protein